MKKRIISAIVLLIILVPLMIIGNLPFVIGISILGLFALKEMMDLDKSLPFILRIIGYLFCLALIIFNYSNLDFNIDYRYILALFIIYSVYMIIKGDIKKFSYSNCLWIVSVILMIGIMFNSIIIVRNSGVFYLLYLVLISCLNDTFALLFGVKFGKTKFVKNISPNKTLEGSIGGMVFGTIFSSLFYYFVINDGTSIYIIILLSSFLSILGQFGDLFFSSIKRNHGVKDFSNLIPGHGGVLDRCDSTLFVSIGYILIKSIIGL